MNQVEAVVIDRASLTMNVPGGQVEVVYWRRPEPQEFGDQPSVPPGGAKAASPVGFGQPFPADPAAPAPQVSGKLGDGRLLAFAQKAISLAVQLGLIKPIPLPV